VSAAAGSGQRPSGLARRLRPLERERPGHGRVRLIETTLLVIAALFLAAATINDLSRQVGINERLTADIRTWRAYTGHAYHNLTVDQQLLGARSKREVVCGNTRPGAPKARRQICLEIWGPVSAGVRSVHGGWYLPPGSEDLKAERFACFGSIPPGVCPR
jgi:hypothetical protein